MTLDSKSIWIVWLASLAFKLSLAVFLPLAPDEAYYWIWSQNLSLSYMDHPGMIAWLLWLGKAFAWIPNGERFPVVLMGHLTLLVWIKIVRSLWVDQLTWRWLISYLLIPFLGLGSVLATPDVPVLFFYSVALLFTLSWLKEPTAGLASAIGMALGLGFCSKYHIVLLPLGALAYFYFERPQLTTAHLRSLLFTFFFGLLFSLPVLVWNFSNDWASFNFQLDHGFAGGGWKPHWTQEYLLGQFLVFTPVFWWLFLKGSRFRQLRIFFWLAIVPWGFFLVSSFKSSVEANWPIVSLAPGLVLAIAAHQNWRIIKAQFVFYGALSTVVISLWLYPWLDSAPDKLKEVHQIREALPKIASYQPLYGGSYQIASALWYYSGQPTYKVRNMSRPDQFDYWEESVPSASVFYVFREQNEPLPAWLQKKKAVITPVSSYDHFELIKVTQ